MKGWMIFVEFHKDETIVSIVESLFFARMRFDLSSRELTYPTWGKGKSSPKVPWYGIFCHSEGCFWFPTELLLRSYDGGSCWPHTTKARPPMIWKSAKSRCQTSLVLRGPNVGIFGETPRKWKKPFAPGGPWKIDGKGRWSLSFWNMAVHFQGRTIYLNFQGVLKMVCAALFLRFCKKIPTWLNQIQNLAA